MKMQARFLAVSAAVVVCVLLDGCVAAIPLMQVALPAASVGGGMFAGAAIEKHQSAQNGTDVDMATYSLATPVTREDFLTRVKETAASQHYDVASVSPMPNGGEMIIATKHAPAKLLGFGGAPPMTTLNLQLAEGGQQVTINGSARGDKEKLSAKDDIDAFGKALGGEFTAVVATTN